MIAQRVSLGAMLLLVAACGVQHKPHGVDHGCEVVAQTSNWSPLQFTIHDDDTRSCPSLEPTGSSVSYGGLIEDAGEEEGWEARVQPYNSDGNAVGSEGSDWFDDDPFYGWSAQPWGNFTSGTGSDIGRDYPEVTVDFKPAIGGYAWVRVMIDYFQGQA